jgi:hypothetical protein
MKAMLRTYPLTTQEVVARLQRKWSADVRVYDATSGRRSAWPTCPATGW